MNMTLFLSVVFISFVIFSIAEAVHGEEKPVEKAFHGMTRGAFALLALHVFQPATGVAVPISALTLMTSLIGGLPGSALIFFINAFIVGGG